MLIQAFTFYLFAGTIILSAIMVIVARNPVHSVLFLILAFFNAAGLFILLGAEFIALILVIVYVGAVAVLFLFVVMMLDINFADLRKGAMQYIPIGLVVGGILLFELVAVYGSWQLSPEVSGNLATPTTELVEKVTAATGSGQVTNTEMLGLLIYTKYILAFQVAGLILLVAMVGAIVLTLRRRPDVRKQSVSKQQSVKVEEILEIVKVTPKTGI